MDSLGDPDMMNRYLAGLNYTDRIEVECSLALSMWHAEQQQEEIATTTTTTTCPPDFDTVDCWPVSEVDTLVVMPCFAELHGIKYDTKGRPTHGTCYL